MSEFVHVIKKSENVADSVFSFRREDVRFITTIPDGNKFVVSQISAEGKIDFITRSAKEADELRDFITGEDDRKFFSVIDPA